MDQNRTYCRISLYAGVIILLLLSCLVSPSMVYGQIFQLNTTATLTGVAGSSAAWGDDDHDGDLDILLTGTDGSTRISQIYRNDAGVFTDIHAGLTGVQIGCVAWGDYDHDGDLDILLTGFDGTTAISQVYRNDAGVFTDIHAALPGVEYSSVVWGDYDNDGDLDILLTGFSDSNTVISRIYRNDSGAFTDIHAGLTGVQAGSVAWGDYDNDGDLDVLLTGFDGNVRISQIYRNNAGVFTDIHAGLMGVSDGSVAWGDYDNDGDLDILLTGADISSTFISRIYRNDAGVFTDIHTGLPGVLYSSVAWGDYDHDGDLDILLTGSLDSSTRISRVYRNDAGVFTDIHAGLPGVHGGSVAWGDYNKDGRLDILITGQDNNHTFIAQIWKNSSATSEVPDVLATVPGISLTIYPNPAQEQAIISVNPTPDRGNSAQKEEVLTLRILTLMGQEVAHYQSVVGGTVQIATGSLASGVYFVRIERRGEGRGDNLGIASFVVQR